MAVVPSPSDLAIISALSGESVEVLASSPAALAVGRLLIRDGLTGLYNFQYFQRRLEMVLEEAADSRTPVSLLVLDLDGLKQVNDTLGHEAGNRVIAAAGQTLAARVPDPGFVARYGGDEFVAALPGWPEGDALALARAVQTALAQAEIGIPGHSCLKGIAASVGVASSETSAAAGNGLFAAADEAMYQTKRRGKGGVFCYSALQQERGKEEWRVGRTDPPDGTAPTPGTAAATRTTPASGEVTLLCCQLDATMSQLAPEEEAGRSPGPAFGDDLAQLSSWLQRSGGFVFRPDPIPNRLCAAFARAADAVQALTALLQPPLPLSAPPLPPRSLRMALHAGYAAFTGGEYRGAAVRRCSDLVDLTSRGQVLLPAALARALEPLLPATAGLHDLGRHRLRDLYRTEHLFALTHPNLPGEATSPPLSLDVLKHNLPTQPTPFLGREREMVHVHRLLGSTRLLTLTGPGGAGKTRLALQVASRSMETFQDGVWLVELAGIQDPAQLPHAVAVATGLRGEPVGSPLAALQEHLRGRQLLLVLDNCEHLLLACRELLTALLPACPKMQVLATSREALSLAGETVWTVPGLALPDPGRLPPMEQLEQYDGVRFFVERARLQQPDFQLTPENAAAVVDIGRRLDGLALALELAAARVSTLTVPEIAERLDRRFQLLAGGHRGGSTRHQTLRALVDWSDELLSEKERLLWYRLSAFAGSFSLQAAEEVCSGGSFSAGDVLNLLDQLVRKSLVVMERRGESRYRMLETLRIYAAEKLAASGEAVRLHRRHRDWYLSLVETVDPPALGPRKVAWLDRLEAEGENLWAALRWSRGQGELDEELRLVRGLITFWTARQSAAGKAWLDSLLDTAAVRESPGLRARILHGTGLMAYMRGHHEAAAAYYQECLTLRRQSGDTYGMAKMLVNSAVVAEFRGEWDRALLLWEECAAKGQQVGYRFPAARLAMLRLATAEVDRSRVVNQLNWLLREIDQSDEPVRHANARWYAAEVARFHRAYAWAAARAEEALTVYRALRFRTRVALMLTEEGQAARGLGDYHQAAAMYAAALEFYRELGGRLKEGEADCLEGVAALAAVTGNPAQAARLFGAAQGLRDTHGVPIRPLNRPGYEDDVASLQETSMDDAVAAAWAEGRTMTLPQAIEYALVTVLAPLHEPGEPSAALSGVQQI